MILNSYFLARHSILRICKIFKASKCFTIIPSIALFISLLNCLWRIDILSGAFSNTVYKGHGPSYYQTHTDKSGYFISPLTKIEKNIQNWNIMEIFAPPEYCFNSKPSTMNYDRLYLLFCGLLQVVKDKAWQTYDC